MTSDAAVLSLLEPDVRLIGPPRIEQDASLPPLQHSRGEQNGESIVPLRRGSRAPYNGVLFNGPAVAQVTVDFNAENQLCSIERQHDHALFVANYSADVASLRLALDTQRREAMVLLDSSSATIRNYAELLQAQERTNHQSSSSFLSDIIWAGGGVIAGFLILGSILIFGR